MESDKENGLVLYGSKSSLETHLVEMDEGPMENIDPVPVPVPVFDFAGIAQLMTVRGQRAVRSLGPPKSLYHPYSTCCAIGKQSTTHRPSHHCLRLKTQRGEQSLSCKVGNAGLDTLSSSSGRVAGEGGWSNGGRQQQRMGF